MTDLRARLAEVLADHANDADFIDYGGTIGPLIDFVCAPALDRALEDAERVPALESALSAAEADSDRFEWLTTDHADPEERKSVREILGLMSCMSYSAACASIDAAMLHFFKLRLLTTADTAIDYARHDEILDSIDPSWADDYAREGKE